ncbi:peptide ABC transporter substrate-binding protein [Georgenia sp. 10Sc9-8]|uniref:Peptide ABC transporter substrate-binding protein n=1 Tax=Georgenia halotolerans TaxID=3028317 RepID=A0ABT5TW79_9MICO|nr:peptide ABC transporter substrate-binding protein [Georgenia halotolerans]
MAGRRRRGTVAALAGLMAVTACGGLTSEGQERRLENGTLIVGLAQEPAIMNPWVSEGNLQATHSLTLPVLYPLWRLGPDFEYEPLLLDGEPETSEDPFTVTYRLKEEATWSDGVPITAEDIQFTLETCLDEDFAIAVRAGCEMVDMEASEIVDDKTYRMVFTEPYAPWRSLFSNAAGSILPAHELEGKDFDEVWDEGITVASGPLQFESWSRGQQMTLTRNENFWGESTPGFERLVLRFIEDSSVQVQALRGREIDMLSSQPQIDLVDQVGELEGVEYEVVAGGVWEFFEFNHGVEGLGPDFGFVREAIAMGIDRERLVDTLIGPMNPDAVPLQSIVYVNSQPEYEPAFDQWDFDPDGARQLLEENGCTEGDDGIYSCDGVRLSFDYAYTSGSELRELQFVIIQAFMQDIGIELSSQTQDAASFFGDLWPSGEEGAWHLFNQAWLNTADPNPALGFWECDGEMNFRSYCNEEVDELIAASRVELDQDTRADLLNEANALMADDLPALPLYQSPVFLAWTEQVQGPQTNPTDWGPFWNVEEWGPR